MSIKLQTSNLFATFKTEKEVADYIDQHIPEEKDYFGWDLCLAAIFQPTRLMKILF